MLPIPPDVLLRYDKTLSQQDIPAYQQPHYRRWLRFYLDFCGRYDLPALEGESVQGVIRKLQKKAQPEWMRKQAVDVVRRRMVRRRRRRPRPGQRTRWFLRLLIPRFGIRQ